MTTLRKRLSWFAAFWICCQTAGFVAAPVVFGVTAHASAAVPVDAECDCPGTLPGQACPMHGAKKGHEQTREDENACRLRNTCETSDAALLTLTGTIGVLPVSSSVNVDLAPAPAAQLALNPIARAKLPEAPPPRS